MDNIDTYLHGKKLFISIDLAKNLGKTQSGKSLNVATSRGYSRLNSAPELRLKLHLYRAGNTTSAIEKSDLGSGANTDTPDFNHILALVSGLANESRQELIGQIKQMISRDALN
jgi:hypothetical protein